MSRLWPIRQTVYAPYSMDNRCHRFTRNPNPSIHPEHIASSNSLLLVVGGFLRTVLSVLGLFSMLLTSAIATQSDYESELIDAVRSIVQSDLSTSISKLQTLVATYPNSQLGYLLLADLYAVRAGRLNFSWRASAEPSPEKHGLRDELATRWKEVNGKTPATQGLIPDALILSGPKERHILVADASHARLYVYENTGNNYRLVDDFFMSIGEGGMVKTLEGDLRTPEGVYSVTSYIAGNTLPPKYGPGAFPINYPNEYDQHLNRTGYGIWIHGTDPGFFNKVPLASEGCLTLSNPDFTRIKLYISTDGNTPVIISRSFHWIDPMNVTSRRSTAMELLKGWERDWESLDAQKYLAHYSSKRFPNFDEFSNRKISIHNKKDFIDLKIRDLSVYGYPSDQDMLVVTFTQDYRSNNYQSVTQKRQYWDNVAGIWQIIYEREL